MIDIHLEDNDVAYNYYYNGKTGSKYVSKLPLPWNWKSKFKSDDPYFRLKCHWKGKDKKFEKIMDKYPECQEHI
jgi:hypothetical protein